MTRFRRRRIVPPVVLFVAVAVAVVFGAGTALAAFNAVARGGVGFYSARWAVMFTSAPPTWSATGPATEPLDSDTFPYFTNFSSVALTSTFSFTMPMSATGGATAQLEQCNTGWDTTNNVCAGTITPLAYTGQTNPVTFTGSLPTNTYIRFRLHPTANGAGNTATLHATVTNH
jgi:hypothetical protein